MDVATGGTGRPLAMGDGAGGWTAGRLDPQTAISPPPYELGAAIRQYQSVALERRTIELAAVERGLGTAGASRP